MNNQPKAKTYPLSYTEATRWADRDALEKIQSNKIKFIHSDKFPKMGMETSAKQQYHGWHIGHWWTATSGTARSMDQPRYILLKQMQNASIKNQNANLIYVIRYTARQCQWPNIRSSLTYLST